MFGPQGITCCPIDFLSLSHIVMLQDALPKSHTEKDCRAKIIIWGSVKKATTMQYLHFSKTM